MPLKLKSYIYIRRMDNCVGGKPIENLGVSKLLSRIVTQLEVRAQAEKHEGADIEKESMN